MSLIAAILVAAVSAASGPPDTPPPKVGGAGVAPPPAWVEAGRRSVWATYGSYCWSSPGKSAACVDMIPPASRPDLARLAAKTGTRVRLHLGFAPRSVRVYRVSGAKRTPVASQAGRTVSWRARTGIFDVKATSTTGSASYLVRLTAGAAA
jgi:hypothetical protein